jgi:dipeptidyl aminopeptidase/acylaminoacyl peptidase
MTHSRARFLRLSAALAASVCAGRANGLSADLPSALQSALTRYMRSIVPLSHKTGEEQAYDYANRLNDDLAALAAPVPNGYTASEYQTMCQQTARADLDLVNQLLDARVRPIRSLPGMQSVFVTSSADATLQPVAFYVPLRAHSPMPMVVLLHGRPQTETQLLANPMLQRLAESTGSLLVAPYGRGYYDYRGVALHDVDDAIDAALKTFSVDPRRRYLGGYSMGGFSVFEVAPRRHDFWSAVLCVSGALLGHDAAAVTGFMARTPFYFVTGTDDQSIPTQYTVESATYLQRASIPVSLYSQPKGEHRLVTLAPALERAWRDMHDGTIRAYTASAGESPVLPMTMPSPSLKP